MNIRTRIYNDIFGIALPAEDAPMAEKILWQNNARTEIVRAEVAKYTFEGSEKQVAWVEKIVRLFFYKALCEDYLYIIDYTKALREACEVHKDSQYWISRRDKSISELFPEVEKEIDDIAEDLSSQKEEYDFVLSRM